MPSVRISQLLLSGILLFTFLSCARVHYIGESYSPTQRIKVFYEEEQIPDSYEIMGKAVASAGNDKQGRYALIKRAQKEGADAVLIENMFNSYYQNSDNGTNSKLQIQAKFYREIKK